MKRRILILEDDPSTLDVLTLLFSEDYHVTGILTFALFWEAIKRFKPHLVIIDQLLSEPIKGIDICDQLASDENLKHLPIILLSALSGIAILKDYINFKFVEKPFDIDTLQDTVKVMLINTMF